MIDRLHVTISGLCLLVAKGEKEIWALMIKDDGTIPHHPPTPQEAPSSEKRELHAPLVAFQEKYVKNSSDVRSTRLACRDLAAPRITYTGGATDAHAPTELATVVGNLTTAHGVTAPPTISSENWFDPSTIHPQFAGWVRFFNVDSVDATVEKFWRYRPFGVQRLPTAVTFVMENVAETELKIDTSAGPLVLVPRDGELEVEFHHVPPSQNPVQPKPASPPDDGMPPMHFFLIQRLLNIPIDKHPMYVKRQPKGKPKPKEKDAKGAPSLLAPSLRTGVNPYACLTLPVCPKGDPSCP